MGGIDLDVIKGIPGYKVIMKAVLKHQIQQLVEQLSETTGEESILLTASVTDGSLSHLGSESGKSFLEGHEEIKSQFLGHVLKIHHSKKTEKQFAAGPGRKSDAHQSLMYEGEDESAYSETHFSTEAQQSIQQPSVSVNRPMERGKRKLQNKVPRSSEIKTRPRRSAAATRSPFKSDLYVANEEDIEDFDLEQDELETTSRITSLDKTPVKYSETMPLSGPTVSDPKQDSENSFKTEGYDCSGVFSEGMGTLEEHGSDSIVIVKKEVESDQEAGTATDEEDPDWEPGKKKQRKSSGSMSVTSAVGGQTQIPVYLGRRKQKVDFAVVESYGLSIRPDFCYLVADCRVVVPKSYVNELQEQSRWKSPTKMVKEMMDDMMYPEQYGIPGGLTALKSLPEVYLIIQAIESYALTVMGMRPGEFAQAVNEKMYSGRLKINKGRDPFK